MEFFSREKAVVIFAFNSIYILFVILLIRKWDFNFSPYYMAFTLTLPGVISKGICSSEFFNNEVCFILVHFVGQLRSIGGHIPKYLMTNENCDWVFRSWSLEQSWWRKRAPTNQRRLLVTTYQSNAWIVTNRSFLLERHRSQRCCCESHKNSSAVSTKSRAEFLWVLMLAAQ